MEPADQEEYRRGLLALDVELVRFSHLSAQLLAKYGDGAMSGDLRNSAMAAEQMRRMVFQMSRHL